MHRLLAGADFISITPHIGSASLITRKNMALIAAENLLAGLHGETPPNCVNPEALRGQALSSAAFWAC